MISAVEQKTRRAVPQPSDWPIEPATESDWPGIWEIFRDVVSTADTYAYAPDTTEEAAKDMWMGAGKYGTGAAAFVVRDKGNIVGTFSLRANHFGQGSHVANAAYMTRGDYRGKGIARAMCRFSLEEAKRRGFLSMQFNYVVSTNSGAVELWQSLGFNIIGISPKSFRHATFGLVDIYIMHRFLDGVSA
jgi:L-amino acid N-acyltransferase YncA